MVDKKTELDLKSLKDFLEFWVKFHVIYDNTVSRDIISKEDEEKFLETRNTIRQKYEELKGSLEFKYMPHSRMTDPVNEVLLLDSMRLMSEKNLKKLGDDWKDSYVFLNSILERLKNKKRRLEQFNPVGVFFKRILDRRAS